ncbi:MAG: Colicin I receptor [Stenotrophomonas maltophilia]|uniref:Colicin I receptor n=1 Tax=Stenotrophomonas maltophilia TaxID=40324 RepID=A0A7V8FK46_STEMA|nr:MAG: Colicin I receptor [Stenotrophomonas maltophilia]
MQIKTPLAVAITLTLAVGTAAAAPAGGQQALASTGVAAGNAVDLDRVEVRAQLESQIRAVDLKRSSDAIEDAVSSDALGQYPDQNVAESLQRLPGISVTRDQGEGRFVVVRGLDANLNSVSVDGIAIGTPDSTSRAAPLDVIPSDSTERLRVVKSPTPDMPGDAIGGAILVESASAFDRSGRSLRGKIEASHQQLSDETSPKAAFNYSEVFNNTFGVAAGVNYQKRTFESDNSEVEYEGADGVDPTKVAPGDVHAINLQHRKYEIERKRIGANLNLDWRPNEDSRYYLRTLYSQFDDAETRQRVIFNFDAANMVPNGTDQYRLVGMPKDSIDKRMRYRTKEENTFAASLGGENKLTGAVVDYKAGYTRTEERVNDEIETRFKLNGKAFNGTLDQRSRLPSYSFDNDQWLDNANYKFDRIVAKPKQVNDEERSAQVNIRFDGDNSSYKFGVLGRWRDRDVNVDEASLRVGPAINLKDWTTGSPEHRHGSMGQGMDSDAMRRYWAQHSAEYSGRPQDAGANAATSLEGDYTAREDIFASYAMGTWDIGALRVIRGVRVESTRFSATGNRVDVASNGRSFSVTPVQASKSYTNVLPDLHLRYDAGNDWVLRFAANKTVARPGFGDASPRVGLARNDNEVRLGNPNLNPYESTNLDLSVEKYIGSSGIISLGVFHKSIDGYIVETRQQGVPGYDGLPVTTAINGNKAKVRGAEFNWQQQLDFLPSGWDGLLVGASGTWLDTSFDAGIAARAGEDFHLPRASKNVYSAHVGYEKYGLSTRLAAVHRSEYLDSIGAGRAFDIYVAPNTQLDFSLDYRFTPRVSMYLEAQNLLDKPLELYQGNRSRTLQMEEYGRTYAIGLKVAL